jgi:hypothetical protein
MPNEITRCGEITATCGIFSDWAAAIRWKNAMLPLARAYVIV